MKKFLLIASVILAISSCSDTKAPKEVAKEFVTAVYSSDASAASTLATEKTKANIVVTKSEMPAISAEEGFSLSTLTETVSGNTAEAKNDLIKLTLEKEGDGWKVAATPELIAGINNRQQDLQGLKLKWDALQKEYEARLQMAKEYVQYKKGLGELSAKMKTLEEMVNTLSVKTTWDKEKIKLYLQRQQQLDDMIDKSVEPSLTANADMQMNYILQLSNAKDRIKTAQNEYQALAEKTPSATYPVLSL